MYTDYYKGRVTITGNFNKYHEALDLTKEYKAEKFSLENGVCKISANRYFDQGVWWNDSPWQELEFDDGYRLREFHNFENYLKVGDRVIKGQAISREGNTGNVKVWDNGKLRPITEVERRRGVGSHTHVVIFDPQGKEIDPVTYLFRKHYMTAIYSVTNSLRKNFNIDEFYLLISLINIAEKEKPNDPKTKKYVKYREYWKNTGFTNVMGSILDINKTEKG